MKAISIVLAFVFLVSSPLFAQSQNERQYPSQFSNTESADILPNLTLFGRVTTGLFTSDISPVEGQISFGIADFIELNVLNSASAVNFYGDAQLIPQWGFKLRLLEASEKGPGVAFLFRTSFDWRPQTFWQQDIARKRSAFYQQGLNGTRHSLRLTSGTLIATQTLFSRLHLTGGLGVQEVQVRDLWIFIDPAPYASNGYHASEIQHNLMVSGLVQAQIDVSNNVLAFFEAQAVPMIEPNLQRLSLTYKREYLTSAGVRFVPLFPVSMDVMISHSFMELQQTEFRMSLGIVVGP